MTSHCENITPLASRYDPSILRLDSSDFGAILDSTLIANLTGINDGTGLNGGVGLNRQTLVDVTNLTNNILDLSDLTNFPTLKDRYDQGPVTFVEIADFINTNSYDIGNLNTDIKDYVPSPVMPVPIDSYLGDLDYYLNKNFGASISGGICGSFNNFFSQLAALFVLIDVATDLIGDIKNLSEKDPLKKLKSLTLNEILKKIKDKILEIVDKVVEQLKKRVRQVVAATVATLGNIAGASQMVYKKIQEISDDINELFEADSMEEFKKKIEAFMAKTAGQFERLTVENVALMMFRFCQMSEVIEGLLNSSVDNLKNLATSIAVENKVLTSMGLKETEKAVKNGAIRIGAEDRIAKKAEAEKQINASSPKLTSIVKGEQSNYITPAQASQEELKTISALTEDGIPGKFTFASQVKNQNDYEGKKLKGAGWKKIDQLVLIKLLRVCEQTGKEFIVNSGYRSPVYNKEQGGASTSQHMTGKAIDIKVKGSYEDRASVVVAMSRAGFTAIGIYSSFIHGDTRPGRVSWVAGEPNNKSNYPVPKSHLSGMIALAARHDRDQLRNIV